VGEAACDTFQIGKNAVTPFIVQTIDGVAEELIVIHRKIRTRQAWATPWHRSF
jgi:hypothetical protein